jgi:hypothetical protein
LTYFAISITVFLIVQGFTAYEIGNTIYVFYSNLPWFQSQVSIPKGANIVSIPLGLWGTAGILGVTLDDVLYISGIMSFVFATLEISRFPL